MTNIKEDMEVFMKKTVIAKVIFAAILVLLTLTFVTCEDLLANIIPKDDGEDGYTDVVYETVGTGSDVRIKSVTLYLDGEKVPRTAESRKLDLEAARMGHDFFEVVFWNVSPGTTPVTNIARTSWEIGQQAGISGLYRNGNASTPGVNYTAVTQISTPNASTGSSIIFVGKKSSKTLLGVGYLTHINDKRISATADPPVSGSIVPGDRSVTFTVAPLETWLGFSVANTTIQKGINGGTTTGTVATFMTASGIAATVIPTTGGIRVHRPAGVTAQTTPSVQYDTLGANTELIGGIEYPLFHLPSVQNWGADDTVARVEATYTVGGLDADTAVGKPALYTAIRTWGSLAGDGDQATADVGNNTNDLKGGLQFIKRTPSFMYQGRTFGVEQYVVDKGTSVYIGTITPATGIIALAPTTYDTNFNHIMPLVFEMTKQSAGVFAITFQQPVYALTFPAATNSGNAGVTAEKWWIRPDYGQYQYLLDNGKDSGGAVLLGTDLSGGVDWLEIKTTGIGFDNE